MSRCSGSRCRPRWTRRSGSIPTFSSVFACEGNRLYARPAESIPAVWEKRTPGILALDHTDSRCEAQVSYTGSTILLEYSHGVTDGRGGLAFLLYLTAEYLARRYGGAERSGAVPVPPLEAQTENGYRTWGRGFYVACNSGRAYHLRGEPASPTMTTYRLSVSRVRASARRQGASVTEYLAALLCLALLRVQQKDPRARVKKKVRLTVPVDLRPRFGCQTMRNFAVNIYPARSPGEAKQDLAGICAKIRGYMRAATAPERLRAVCGAADKAGSLAQCGWLPAGLKGRALRAFLNLPFQGTTLTFSNLGAVRLPDALRGRVAGLDFAITPKPGGPYTCTLVTLGDEMRLTLLRAIRPPLLEGELESIFQNAL